MPNVRLPLHGFACASAAEAESASQRLGILSQHYGQVLAPNPVQKIGHVSHALFAEFEQLMQSVLIVHKGLNVLKQKAKFVRV